MVLLTSTFDRLVDPSSPPFCSNIENFVLRVIKLHRAVMIMLFEPKTYQQHTKVHRGLLHQHCGGGTSYLWNV